jgi:DNA-directed RNA polymerase specialized sigma24 family protein
MTRRPESAFLRTLYRPLLEDCRREIDQALRVALLVHHEVSPSEIAERLEISLGEVKASVKQLARARERLERGPEAEHE